MSPEEKQQMKDLESSVKDLTKLVESFERDMGKKLAGKVDEEDVNRLIEENSPVRLPLDSETTAILLKDVPIMTLPPVANSPVATGYIPVKINGKDIYIMTGQ